MSQVPADSGMTPNEGGSAQTEPEVTVDLSLLEDLGREWGDAGMDVACDLIQLFCSDVPQQLLALQTALSLGDSEEIARRAHTLKGSCGQIGARSMAELSAALERHGRDGSIEGSEALVRQIELQFFRVSEILQSRFKAKVPPPRQ